MGGGVDEIYIEEEEKEKKEGRRNSVCEWFLIECSIDSLLCGCFMLLFLTLVFQSLFLFFSSSLRLPLHLLPPFFFFFSIARSIK